LGTQTNLVDGGVILNDPGMATYAEVLNSLAAGEECEITIVSLGTGASAQPIPYEVSKNWGAVNWIKPLLNATMDGVSATTEYMLRAIADAHSNLTYYRLNPNIDANKTAMDDPSNLPYWEKVTNDFIDQNNHVIQKIISLICEAPASSDSRQPDLQL